MKKETPEIERYCAFCEHSKVTYDREKVLCDKRGIVFAGHICGKFVYDPLKRIPLRRSPVLPDLSDAAKNS